MRVPGPRLKVVAMLALWLCASCTDDFSRFKFDAKAGSDAGPTLLADAESPAASQIAETALDAQTSGRGGDDAPPVGDAANAGHEGSAGQTGAGQSGAGNDLDSGADDEDAAIAPPEPPSPTSLCLNALESLSDQSSTCEACTCQVCIDPVLDCLAHPEAPVRALCQRVLDCAVRNRCHDWDCYCSSQKCSATASAPGDGPCVQAMNAAVNAAVGAEREAVNAAHRANDPTQPLVLALRARACSVGAPAGSVGGATEGRCSTECMK
ncbi:MAG: hypothetical protein RL701_4649 [Pseudomonadota bacterium]